ncbi:hypothetical protein R1sor_025644 [Riccia sorocarpa]|uniref:YDG domain-containing protein n=1 Tax=Riccia sorocarpa TaxID=122646 RepID=A0ABD3GAJ2_9MARC
MDDHGYDQRLSNCSTVNLGGIRPQLCDSVVTNKRSHDTEPPTSVEPTSSASSSDGLKYARRRRKLDNVSAIPTLEAPKGKKLCLGLGGSAAASTSTSSLVPPKSEDGVENPKSEIFVHLEINVAETQEREDSDLDFLDYLSYDVDGEEFLRRLEDESELPSWYSESHLDNPLSSSLLDAYNGKDLKLKGQQASAHLQTEDVVAEASEVPSDGAEASLSQSVQGHHTTTLEDDILPSTPILGVDLDKALTMPVDAENADAFTQAVIRLYNYTAASIARGSFLPAVASTSETVHAPIEGPEQRADRNGSTSLLVPKEETGDFRLQGYLPVTKATAEIFPLAKVKPEPIDEVKPDMVAVKHENNTPWNMASPGQDVVSYESAQELLQRLGEVWFERYKEADDDFKESTPGARCNPDRIRMKVARALRRDGLWLNYNQRPIGHCPGIPVGACFTYRIEMVLTGLHSVYQNGIAVIPADLSPYNEPVSPSVVLLTGALDKYKDDKDMGDEVVYCGHGGYCARTKKYQDQVLERGNLALANSLEFQVPVRLIRGRRDRSSKTGRLYSYDGLYKVIALNFTVGVKGNKVFLFTMVRLPGQGPLPVPSKDALLLRPQDQNESCYIRPSETSRKLELRTPLLENKGSTSAAVPKLPSRSPSVSKKSTKTAVPELPARSLSTSRSRSWSDSEATVKLRCASKNTSASAESVSNLALTEYTPPFTRSQARKFG